MITIESLQDAYARSFQPGGSFNYDFIDAAKNEPTRKGRRAGVNVEKALGPDAGEEFMDFIDYLGRKGRLNDYIGADLGATKQYDLWNEYNNFRGSIGKDPIVPSSGKLYKEKDLQDAFRKVGKIQGGDLQGWWKRKRERMAGNQDRPNAEERDVPDIEPGNGAGEAPITQNPNPGAGNTPNPGVGGGGQRPVNPPIPELPELDTEIEIEEEPIEIPEDEYAELTKKLEDTPIEGVGYIDNSYDKMYHHASRNDLRQFKKGNDYVYGDGMFNTVKAGDNRRENRNLVRGIRQGRREDARNYRKTGEYNYEFKERPEYQSKEPGAGQVARGIRNGSYPSSRNGGVMMRTFLSAMRRGGRL